VLAEVSQAIHCGVTMRTRIRTIEKAILGAVYLPWFKQSSILVAEHRSFMRKHKSKYTSRV